MSEQIKVIVFQLNDEEYGVNIEQVLSIERLSEIISIPKTADYIKGITNLRGEVTPIIDLKERLQIGETAHTSETRILIVNINSLKVGLIVDSATDVIDMDESVIMPPPKMMGGVSEHYVNGVANMDDRLLILLDLKRVLKLEEVNEVKEVLVK